MAATETVILRWAIDSASLQTTKAGVASLRDDILAANAKVSVSYADAAKAAASVGMATDDFISRTGVAIQETRALADAQEDVAAAAGQAAAAELQVAENAKIAATQQKLMQAQQALIGLPGVGFQHPAVFALRGVSMAVGGGASLAAAATGVGAVAAGFLVLTQAMDAVSAAQEKATDAARKYYGELESHAQSTTADIQKEIAAKNQLIAADKESQASLTTLRDTLTGLLPQNGDIEERARKINDAAAQAYRLTGGLVGGLDTDFGHGIAGANTLIQGLNAALDEGNTQITAYTGAIAFLNSLLGTDAIAANDAAAAADYFKDGLSHVREGFYDAQAAGEQFIDKMREKLQTALDNLREGEKSQIDTFMDALAQEGAARDKITQINKDIAAAQADASLKIQDAYAARAEKLALAEQDAADKRADIVQDGLEKVRQIEKDFSRDYADAVGNRDAVAAYKARLHRDDELEKQQTADAKRLREVNQALAKQEKSIERSYDQQVENVMRALNRQLQIQSEALQRANADLQNALYAQQGALVGIHQQTANDLSYIWQTFESTLVGNTLSTVNTLQQAWASLFGGAGGGQIPLSSLPTYQNNVPFVQNLIDARLTQVFNRMGRSGGGLSHVS